MHFTTLSLQPLTSETLQLLNSTTQNFSSSRIHLPRSNLKPSLSPPLRPGFCVIHPLEYLALSSPVNSVGLCLRPFIPLPHTGIHATQRLITARYMWPSINADVRKWAHSCLQSQQSKVQRHTLTPLATFATPDARFDRIHLDLIGPFPPSRGYFYLWTCINRFTR